MNFKIFFDKINKGLLKIHLCKYLVNFLPQIYIASQVKIYDRFPRNRLFNKYSMKKLKVCLGSLLYLLIFISIDMLCYKACFHQSIANVVWKHQTNINMIDDKWMFERYTLVLLILGFNFRFRMYIKYQLLTMLNYSIMLTFQGLYFLNVKCKNHRNHWYQN